MSSILQLFTPKKQMKNEQARQASIQAGKMVPLHDETDALRHEGRGLKPWSGTNNSLLSLGFQKKGERKK